MGTFNQVATLKDINGAIKKQTIALRRSTKIKLPDAIIAATSIALNAVLLTHDDQLLKLSWPSYLALDIPEIGLNR
ncbi:hypothetical protein FACS1894200_12080 [Spirochaetia bacterium]|nr:hypothetical protein FACS1894200_12080 [Spirochaetia bacterium]